MIFVGVRDMLRFKDPAPEHYIVVSYVMGIGLALGLLGLLALNNDGAKFTDTGQLHFDSKMTVLVDSNWALAIVVLVYGSAVVVGYVSGTGGTLDGYCLADNKLAPRVLDWRRQRRQSVSS